MKFIVSEQQLKKIINNKKIKFLFLLGTLKENVKESNTHTLCQLVIKELEKYAIKSELIHIRSVDYMPDVKNRNDEFDEIIKKIIACDSLILATPVWWGQHSSFIQSVLERMSVFDDSAITDQKNVLYGKTFGTIITNNGDGVQQTLSHLTSFATQLGFTIPPQALCYYSGKDGSKGITKNKETKEMIEIFSKNMYLWTDLIKKSDVVKKSQEKFKYSGILSM